VPRAALTGPTGDTAPIADIVTLPSRAFVDPDPYDPFTSASRVEALRGIADILRRSLGRLTDDDLVFVNALADRTLDKGTIKQEIMDRFPTARPPEETPILMIWNPD